MNNKLKKIIDFEIKKILFEQEKNNVFGKYLWADKDEKPQFTGHLDINEKNTKLEKRFFELLDSFILGDSEKYNDLEAMFKNVIAPLNKQGKFTKYLQPPHSTVYRGLQKIDIKTLSNLVKISVEDLKNNFENPKYIKKDFIISPKNNSLMSWTSSKNIALDFVGSTTASKKIFTSVLLIANTGENFYLNLENISNAYRGFYSAIDDEKETISLGDVTCTGAFIQVKTYNEKVIMKNLSDKFDKIFDLMYEKFLNAVSKKKLNNIGMQDFRIMINKILKQSLSGIITSEDELIYFINSNRKLLILHLSDGLRKEEIYGYLLTSLNYFIKKKNIHNATDKSDFSKFVLDYPI